MAASNATSITLYEATNTLAALIDTAESVTPEQLEDFRQDLTTAGRNQVKKIDNTAHVLLTWDAKQVAIDAEIARLQNLKKHLASIRKKLGGYVVWVIQGLGRDKAGKYKKLEGETTILELHEGRDSVIRTEGPVPAEYTIVTITMRGDVWQAIKDLPITDPETKRTTFIEDSVLSISGDIDKQTLHKVLQKQKVPGVDLKTGPPTLHIR